MEEEGSKLHILMVPWLAMGHLIPFLELSKRLALKGIKISFFSTPSNILRLPSIPQSLKPLISFIPCSLRSNDDLPFKIENTNDLHSEADRPLLDQAYAGFERYLIDFLSNSCEPKPSWIFYDYPASFWAPSLASRFNINSALFCIVNAVALAFLSRAIGCESAEELTTLKDRLPFATAVTFRLFEARKFKPMLPKQSYPKQLTLIKTCRELEANWLGLLGDRYFPVGLLPTTLGREEESETWVGIREWLDEQEDFSVVYVAFGSESELTREQIDEIGSGLEKSGLPFVWVLPAGSPPAGFAERTAGRGRVLSGWVPQLRLLAHAAIGGFLTHCGWNSAIEGMVVGATLVVLPLQFEQGLTARNLVESGYGVEVERNGEDGSFRGEDISRKLRMAMVEEEGEELRKKARQGKEIFGSEKLQEKYLDELIKKLLEKKEIEAQPV